MSGNSYTQDMVEQEWIDMMRDVKDDYGRDISVILCEDHPPLIGSTPEAEGSQYTFLHLALPFEKCKASVLGLVLNDSDFNIYREEVFEQIQHQTGLRLQRLAEHFDVRFSSTLLA